MLSGKLLWTASAAKRILASKINQQFKCTLYVEYFHHFTLPSDGPFWPFWRGNWSRFIHLCSRQSHQTVILPSRTWEMLEFRFFFIHRFYFHNSELTFLSDPPSLSSDPPPLHCLHPHVISSLSLYFLSFPLLFVGSLPLFISPSHFQTSLLLGYTWGPFSES